MARERLQVWLERWYRFAAPRPRAQHQPWNAEQSDLARRGQMLAVTLLGFLLAVAAVILLLLALLPVQAQDETSMLDLAAATVAGCGVLGLARLNHAGHTSLAGFLTWLLFAVVIIGNLALLDGASQGGYYSWTDMPGWDLLAALLVVVALTLRPRLAWGAFVLYVGVFACYVLWLVPPEPGLLALTIHDGLVPPGPPSTAQSAALAVALLYRPAIIGFLMVSIGILANRSHLWALRDRDRYSAAAQQEWSARQASEQERLMSKYELQVRTEQQHWATVLISSINQAMSEGRTPQLPSLPAGWEQSRELVTQFNLLTSAVRRIGEGQRAERALHLMVNITTDLPVRLEEWRSSGAHADGTAPSPEYLALVTLPSTYSFGHPLADEYISRARYFLHKLAHEEEEAITAVSSVLSAYRRGQPAARPSDLLVHRRLGALVHEVQLLVAAGPPGAGGEHTVR